MTRIQMLSRSLTLLVLAALAGCSTLEDLLLDPTAMRQPVVPVGERPIATAIDPNRFILRSEGQSVIGEPQVVLTTASNALPDFAREYGLGYDEVLAANPGVDIWLPGEDTPVLLPTQFVLPDVAREGIVLNIASKRLFYFPADGVVRNEETGELLSQIVLTYPIGIGRVGWETPLGATEVTAKAVDPHWWVPASVRREHAAMGNPLPNVVPPGPDNPLGSRVLKLGMPGYLIHGTNQPTGVGMRVSHGCIRLYPEDIEFLYELVDIGVPVTIINEPFLLGRVGDEWYFESHEPLEDDAIDPAERLDVLLASVAEDMPAPLQDHVRALASDPTGVPVRIAEYDSQEVIARLRRVENTIVRDPELPSREELREMLDEVVADADEDVGADTGEGIVTDPAAGIGSDAGQDASAGPL